MISPLKHKPVNWIDGMKISSAHFVNTDNFIHDIVRDANSLPLNNNNFGLLPPAQGQSSSLDIQITERASGQVQVTLNQCNAITADGFRIDITRAEQPLTFSHYFGQETINEASETYYVLLTVNPFERVPSGTPDPEEQPIRYPDISKHYSITVLPASQLNGMGAQFMEVGKFVRSGSTFQANVSYIPPCTSLISHAGLMTYYENFGAQINNLQLLSFRIIDKITSKDSVSTIGKNVKLLCDKMLDYIARIYFSYRNLIYLQPPIQLVSCFSEMAHLFFSTVKSMPGAEREELLKYFYEWKDVTPGNFEELLARLIEIIYNHHEINSSMTAIDEFMRVIVALWNKLSTLEYIGQRKENIVVAEQQAIQTIQTKRTWTLLD
ncbi:hypothetical protein DIU31_018090 [Mucilaginibacter rubeus]|uniref:Type VI secretion system baseplate subunit TssK n=1 Tax=Mucilaginibacter rubeus TaxID=2027860 RepID=A0AAE6MJG2_9SPHI|nr:MULTISPECIES: hypothetical protein [Mucilaginibacter]QEM05329.1 hypothetical protein DIU31_018090 [Mucilaginibacter rubeus]QEM17919.1 hypothetical protein DIU38_018270 [Mucilaginibacter gossypii]QTE45548.1 hypothetical protein J3L19_09410 [Mucilaginibacter rubeus]QTE52145.1 hypothetical protein J3L21_09390 [Mucilaginibacter rubeus]QTE57233.1 hypothetical protein J3L23_01065 [Mucilaginibacter rubeus]